VFKIPKKRIIDDLIQDEVDELPKDLDIEEYEEAQNEIEQRYLNLSDEEREALEDALRIEWENEIKAHANEKVKRKQDKIRLYWLIKGQLSVESLDAVKQHLLADWAKLEISRDPLVLWNALKETHTSYSTGLKQADEAKARQMYSGYRQGKDQSLTDFKERYEGILRSMESLGLAIPSEEQQAADFLQKLNERFGRRRVTLENNARCGMDYPSTLFEAYKLISEIADLAPINGTSASVFATTQEVGGGKKGNGSKKKSDEAGTKKKTEGAKKDSDEKEFKGKCFRCDKVGHRATQCPEAKKDDDPGSKVHYTQQEILEFFGFTTRIFSTTGGDLQSTVLLDNQAQASVFGNLKMLTDVTDLDVPHRFNGIGASSGVIATQTGSFHGITGLGRKCP